MTDPTTPSATHLHTLFERYGQSPWLDDLTRGYLIGGELSRWVSTGIRGVTSNPTIFQRAIAGSGDYDQQFADLTRSGCSVDEAYWQLVTDDIIAALAGLHLRMPTSVYPRGREEWNGRSRPVRTNVHREIRLIADKRAGRLTSHLSSTRSTLRRMQSSSDGCSPASSRTGSRALPPSGTTRARQAATVSSRS